MSNPDTTSLLANSQVPPTPYEYALISQLSYASNHADLSSKNYRNGYEYLRGKGWEVGDLISENDYFGYLWINHTPGNQNVVIAHRGSQNATSWITDIESVVRLQPGTFIHAAIRSLTHPAVIAHRAKGYRVSTTGHSLGGFLAQVCVFWSQRRELVESYYPDMSAMVFDSPGAIEFLQTISSNLESERDTIDLQLLNIHNFCAMPTVVSTYGTQAGTVWHLGKNQELTFAFANNHRMGNIITEFDPTTGQPKYFRQMTDWPQANYSNYSSVEAIADTLLTDVMHLPFQCLNYLYKKIKGNSTDTWYDKLFKENGEVSSYLHSIKSSKSDTSPPLNTIEEKITSALKAHYSCFPAEEESKRRLSIQHFDTQVRVFLAELSGARKYGLPNIGLEDKLKEIVSEEGFQLVNTFNLTEYGKRTELVLLDASKTIFDFQRNLLMLLRNAGVPSIPGICGNKINCFKEKLERLTHDSSAKQHELVSLKEKIDTLEQVLPVINDSPKRYLYKTVISTTGFELLATVDELNVLSLDLLMVVLKSKPDKAVIQSQDKAFKMTHDDRPKPEDNLNREVVVAHRKEMTGTKITLAGFLSKQNAEKNKAADNNQDSGSSDSASAARPPSK